MIDRLEALLAQGRDSAPLRFGLGNAYLARGDADTARSHLARAVELDPGYSAAWKLLGKALAAAGREHEAVDAWSHGIDAAQTRGDVQAAREMEVFRRRAQRAIDRGD
ncbi:MAG: tetratricopeptide repeat protein [Ectothiorhodospiraceae bacterium]|nr:tetratricopeptide repeat protein [Chromatiales bacterium]MCP5155051.1 tetratricopeptide repeat protein [Ectothiorhodospiraceae bacterium]